MYIGPNSSGPGSFNNYDEEQNSFRGGGVSTSLEIRESPGRGDGGGGSSGERNCSVCSHCARANSSDGEGPHKGPNADTDDSSDETKPTFCESNCSCQSQSRVSREPTPERKNNGIMVKNDKPVLKFSVSAILGGADRDGDKSRLDEESTHFNHGM
jgi:hypothetical protein